MWGKPHDVLAHKRNLTQAERLSISGAAFVAPFSIGHVVGAWELSAVFLGLLAHILRLD
jgi:hypothetical protein